MNFNFRSGDNTENKCEPSPKTQIPTPSFLQKVKTRRSNSNHLFIYFFQHARVTRVRNQICFLSVSFFFFFWLSERINNFGDRERNFYLGININYLMVIKLKLFALNFIFKFNFLSCITTTKISVGSGTGTFISIFTFSFLFLSFFFFVIILWTTEKSALHL